MADLMGLTLPFSTSTFPFSFSPAKSFCLFSSVQLFWSCTVESSCHGSDGMLLSVTYFLVFSIFDSHRLFVLNPFLHPIYPRSSISLPLPLPHTHPPFLSLLFVVPEPCCVILLLAYSDWCLWWWSSYKEFILLSFDMLLFVYVGRRSNWPEFVQTDLSWGKKLAHQISIQTMRCRDRLDRSYFLSQS